MGKCENCLLRSALSSDCGICSGGLPAEQCVEKLQAAIRTMAWDMDYLIRTTDSVRPADNGSLQEIKRMLEGRVEDGKVQQILLGEGVHKDGVCPACGSVYKPLNFCSTGSNLLNHNWRCPDCGASGRTVYESEFLGHFDLVDGNGNKIDTPEDNDHDIYTCPCCGEPFGEDDCFSDGYWDHGSGSYGETGCRARGRMRFSKKFRYHADVRANRKGEF